MSRITHRGWILVALATLATQGCVSRDRWLDCESHLEPINAPAPLARDREMHDSRGKPDKSAPEPSR